MAKNIQNFDLPTAREKSPTELILTRSKRNVPFSDFERVEHYKPLTSDDYPPELIFGSITENRMCWSKVSPNRSSQAKLGILEIEKVDDVQQRGRKADKNYRRSYTSRSRERAHPSTNSDINYDSQSSSPRERSGSKRKSKKRNKDPKKSKKSKRDKYGYYGLIGESDFYNKESEFSAWLDEVLHIQMDEISPFKRIELFRDFIEDYNNTKLPSRKYYDIARWRSKRSDENSAGGANPCGNQNQGSENRVFE
ncbi:hypothetical protein DSO57_1003949 [Entomophthora muscae]|uniref:Uncharacterized protein n=1 Tax=Entomophthora muscae TaxID=34485 RepID=A0ACC2RZJ2_9FUNG|nr:hypothetical protein DSO57_1003949 [Entomophthora muscae]